jgi:hypothetical protein
MVTDWALPLAENTMVGKLCHVRASHTAVSAVSPVHWGPCVAPRRSQECSVTLMTRSSSLLRWLLLILASLSTPTPHLCCLATLPAAGSFWTFRDFVGRPFPIFSNFLFLCSHSGIFSYLLTILIMKSYHKVRNVGGFIHILSITREIVYVCMRLFFFFSRQAVMCEFIARAD